ncbi:hypothetical protein RCO38_07285 [Hydrogenophaga pseudoflava]|nr:hypothetical protein [Hydrogenophaga pseudoflava]MDQ7744154.1 hypothetical protein [Hydrogenophaga pseudoflava]
MAAVTTPQCAFRADEQLLQVEPRVVLAQRFEPAPYTAIGKHGFNTQDQIAHVAVAKHRRATGIGRNAAANLAGPFGTQAQREQTVVGLCGGLHLLEDRTRLDRDRVGHGVDLAHPDEPFQAQHDLGGTRAGRGATGQTGMPALRDNANAVGRTPGDALRDLGRVSGPYDGLCATSTRPKPVRFIPLPGGGLRDQRVFAQQLLDLRFDVRHGSCTVGEGNVLPPN